MRGEYYLVSPLAAPGHLVIGQAGGTIVSVGFAILTLPEDSTILGVSKGPIQPGAVISGDGGL